MKLAISGLKLGKIADFGPECTVSGTVIEGQGLCAAPGLIDMRVTTGEPGRENRETFATAAKAANAGGVTSMVVMPGTNPCSMTWRWSITRGGAAKG